MPMSWFLGVVGSLIAVILALWKLLLDAWKRDRANADRLAKITETWIPEGDHNGGEK